MPDPTAPTQSQTDPGTTTQTTTQQGKDPSQSQQQQITSDPKQVVTDPKVQTQQQQQQVQAPAALTAQDITLPDGFTPNDQLTSEFLSIMNDNMTPKERGDKLIGMYTREIQNIHKEVVGEWTKLNAEWQEAVTKEYGDKLEPTLGRISGLINVFAKEYAGRQGKASEADNFGKELRDAFTLTGAGNHPQIVRFLGWVSEQLGEGTPVTGRPASQGGEKTLAQRIYGT